ncbi:MAG: hypothetical protein LQ348_001889 [Seirophora lacunosa]|nr:MAG: hypothetical protein LQ348_001889 [Seirophora lacunosa]
MASARAASTVARSARNWADCSVHIRISPRPRNLAESKEVLKVLQQYGEVVMYRHLKYEAPNPTLNAALAIYQSEHSATSAVQASPIRFQYQPRSDAWTAQSWKDIVSEGTIAGSSRPDGTQPEKNWDERIQQRGTFLEEGELRHEEGSEEEEAKELKRQMSYPHSDSPDLEGNARIRPDEWGSRYSANTLRNGWDLGRDKSTAPGASSSGAESSISSEGNRNTRSAKVLFEALTKERKRRPRPKEQEEKRQSSPPIREFQLTVAKSIFNHQAYIERQAYYAGFNPDMKTIMAEDLKGRVPLEGHRDCSLNKPDVPLRIRLRRKEKMKPQLSLMELWEKGKRERGEV